MGSTPSALLIHCVPLPFLLSCSFSFCLFLSYWLFTNSTDSFSPRSQTCMWFIASAPAWRCAIISSSFLPDLVIAFLQRSIYAELFWRMLLSDVYRYGLLNVLNGFLRIFPRFWCGLLTVDTNTVYKIFHRFSFSKTGWIADWKLCVHFVNDHTIPRVSSSDLCKSLGEWLKFVSYRRWARVSNSRLEISRD